MNTKDIETLVRLVGNGLRQRKTEPEIVASLISAGVDPSIAPRFFADVRSAIQQGVQSVVIGIDNPPNDPVLLAAYRQGQAAFLGATRSVQWSRLLWLAVAGAIAFVAWLSLRGR